MKSKKSSKLPISDFEHKTIKSVTYQLDDFFLIVHMNFTTEVSP